MSDTNHVIGIKIFPKCLEFEAPICEHVITLHYENGFIRSTIMDAREIADKFFHLIEPKLISHFVNYY